MIVRPVKGFAQIIFGVLQYPNFLAQRVRVGPEHELHAFLDLFIGPSSKVTKPTLTGVTFVDRLTGVLPLTI